MTHVGILTILLLLLWVHEPGAAKKACLHAEAVPLPRSYVAGRAWHSVDWWAYRGSLRQWRWYCSFLINGGGVVSEFRLTGNVVTMHTRSKLNWYSVSVTYARAVRVCEDLRPTIAMRLESRGSRLRRLSPVNSNKSRDYKNRIPFTWSTRQPP